MFGRHLCECGGRERERRRRGPERGHNKASCRHLQSWEDHAADAEQRKTLRQSCKASKLRSQGLLGIYE